MEREQPSWQEKVGKNVRNGGLIAAAIGLILNFEVFVLGLATAGSGEYLARSSKKKKQAMSQAA